MAEEDQDLRRGGAFRLAELVPALPPSLLERVLTHSSWVGDRTHSYERLEFLGDSVLGLAVASHLYERFPAEDEGRLAKLKAFVVSRKSCAVVACRLGVGGLILDLAPASEEERRQLAASTTALGNVLEALIGAAYLSFGFEVVRAAVLEAFADQVAFALTHDVDFKSHLQEYLAQSERTARYRLVAAEGPPHDRVFTSEVLVGRNVKGRGWGRSIKGSEQAAAKEALVRLGVPAKKDG
jgi:ribonuclease III